MATRGPKPKTAANSRPLGKKPPPFTIPGHLNGRVREEFARKAAELQESGVLEGTDVRLIELYAVNYDLVRSAKEELDRDGLTFTTDRGAIVAHPMVGVLNAATIRLRGLIADLNAIKGVNSNETEGEANPWAGLLTVTG